SDEGFSVDSLVHLLGLSRSNFQRKLKAISGYSPGDYLRTYRLKHASMLLLEGNYRISEIAYKVGFKSPSYFTKAFLKAFQMTPTEFAAQKKMTDVSE
ncbi:MAG: helix-turn-helix domain-containing protein, partial [Sphingobacterium sp.]